MPKVWPRSRPREECAPVSTGRSGARTRRRVSATTPSAGGSLSLGSAAGTQSARRKAFSMSVQVTRKPRPDARRTPRGRAYALFKVAADSRAADRDIEAVLRAFEAGRIEAPAASRILMGFPYSPLPSDLADLRPPKAAGDADAARPHLGRQVALPEVVRGPANWGLPNPPARHEEGPASAAPVEGVSPGDREQAERIMAGCRARWHRPAQEGAR